MTTPIAQIEALYHYPVKSMAGAPLDSANLTWHGIENDRRLAFRRLNDRGGFPWLSASQLPDLLRFTPHRSGDTTHVHTPDGADLPVFSDDLAGEITRRHGAPVQMMHMRQGIFDEAAISVIALDTVREISRLAGIPADVRRFRPNIVVRLLQPAPFQEDDWVGGVLSFGDESDAPAITVTQRDVRCSMVNLEPDSAAVNPEVLKAIVRVHQNTAGVYASVTRTGRLFVGHTVFLNLLPTESL